jgi:hypothetical protein
MGNYRRTMLAGVQEKGQVLGLDIRQVPGQDSASNTHTLEHDPASGRIDFTGRWTGSSVPIGVRPCIRQGI